MFIRTAASVRAVKTAIHKTVFAAMKGQFQCIEAPALGIDFEEVEVASLDNIAQIKINTPHGPVFFEVLVKERY